MQNIILTLFSLFIFVTSSSAQFAVVSDEGGFVNVYDEEKEELDRLGIDGVVSIKEMGEEWALVDYTKYGDYAASSGYIKRSNLIDIASFTEIPLRTDSAHSVVLSLDSVVLRLEAEHFDSLLHVVSYFSDSNRQITAINEEPYWGTRTGLPIRQYKSISCTLNGTSIEFPKEAMFNLFNPHLSLTKAYYDKSKDTIYLVAANGDASGAYSAVWILEDGEYGVHYIFD